MIISPDKSGRIDPVVYDILKGINSPVPLVPITRLENFVFNEELLKLDKWILVDYSEYGWDYHWFYTPMLGDDHDKSPFYPGDEWKKMEDFIRDRPPVLTFKRELLKRDATQNVLPIEYPAFNEIPEPQSKEAYDKRPFEVFFNWGLSHPSRPKLHGKIWEGSTYLGYSVCDNLTILDKFMVNEHGRKWLTINTQWYARFEMKDILMVNGMAKLSVALFGAGRRCFRHTEASVNSLMVMPEDFFASNFPWISEQNCLKFIGDDWVAQLDKFSQRKDLYPIYVAGVENCRKYYLPDYCKHIENIIKEHT